MEVSEWNRMPSRDQILSSAYDPADLARTTGNTNGEDIDKVRDGAFEKTCDDRLKASYLSGVEPFVPAYSTQNNSRDHYHDSYKQHLKTYM